MIHPHSAFWNHHDHSRAKLGFPGEAGRGFGGGREAPGSAEADGAAAERGTIFPGFSQDFTFW